jgi:hypothetical protein
MVGHYQEIWWCLTNKSTAFIETVEGSLRLNLKVVDLWYENADMTPMNDGSIQSSWTAAKTRMRAKGWVRIDPVLRSIGAIPNAPFPEFLTRADHIKLADAVCSVDVLVAIAELNECTWSERFIREFPSEITGRFVEFVNGSAMQLQSKADKLRKLSNLDKSIARWRDAFIGARNVMRGIPVSIRDNEPIPVIVETAEVQPSLAVDDSRAREALERAEQAESAVKEMSKQIEALMQMLAEKLTPAQEPTPIKQPAKRGYKVANNPPPVAGA